MEEFGACDEGAEGSESPRDQKISNQVLAP